MANGENHLDSPEAYERLAASMQGPFEFGTVRSHHYRNYDMLLRTLAQNPELSLYEAALREANEMTIRYGEACAALDEMLRDTPRAATKYVVGPFRERIGRSVGDETAPKCQAEDCIGGDAVGYRNDLACDYFALLTLPPETKVHMGPVKDGMCRATRCGFHCDALDPGSEAADLTRFYNCDLTAYLALPAIRGHAIRDRDRYAVNMELISCGDGAQAVGGVAVLVDGKPLRITAMYLTLGLLRDVWTWLRSDGLYLAFDDLPQVHAGRVY